MKKVTNFLRAMKLKNKLCKNSMNHVLQCKLLTVDSFMLPRIIFYQNKAPSALEGALFRVTLYPHYALVVLLCHAFLIRTILRAHMICISWKIFFRTSNSIAHLSHSFYVFQNTCLFSARVTILIQKIRAAIATLTRSHIFETYHGCLYLLGSRSARQIYSDNDHAI